MKILTKQPQNFGNVKSRKLIRVSAAFLFLFFVMTCSAVAETVTVNGGTIDIETVDNVTNYNVSGNPVWNVPEFNIAESSIYNITGITDNASLAVLVGGDTASNIFGTLNLSNLDFILQNINGINIGSTGVVNVDNANFIASTLPLNLTNVDFLAHQYEFEGSSGFILNEGKIQGTDAELVALVANAIENRGTIEVPMGTVALAAGDLVTVGISADGIVSIGVDPATANELGLTDQIKNSGTITADGGKVVLDAKAVDGLFDHAINLTGEESATSVIRAADGTIEFVAEGGDVVIDGTVEAPAGVINIEADGNVDIQGTVTAAQVDMPEAGTVEVVTDGVINISGTVTAGALEVGPADITLEELQGDITGLVIPDSIVIEETAQVSAGLIMTITGEVVEVGSPISAPTVVIRGTTAVETRETGLIEATSLTINTLRFGTSETPVTVDADSIYLNRLNGEIDLRESILMGDGVWVRGPPEGDTFNLFYNHNAAEVVFDAEKVVLGGTEAIEFYGNLTFYNLECTTPDKVIYFEAGKTYTFKGTLDLGPHEIDCPVFLLSSLEGEIWYINIEADETSIQRVAVRDSYNLGDIDIYTTPSANLGNNTGWILNTTYWTGADVATNNYWSNPNNWDPVWVPWGDDVVFDNAHVIGTADSFIDLDFADLDENVVVGSLTITAGYSGTITADDFNSFVYASYYDQAGGIFDASALGSVSCSWGSPTAPFTVSGGTFIAPRGDLYVLYDFDISGGNFVHSNGNTVFVSGESYTITTGGAEFYNVEFRQPAGTGDAVITLMDSFSVAGNLTASNNAAGSTVVITGDVNITLAGDMKFLTNTAGSGGTSFGSGSSLTVDLTGGDLIMQADSRSTLAADLIFSSDTEQNITQTSGIIDDISLTIDKASDVVKLLTNASSFQDIDLVNGTLDLNGYDLTINGTFSNEGTLKLLGDETITGSLSDAGSGIVEYYGSDGYTGLILGDTYYDLVFSGASEYVLDAPLTVSHNLTLSNASSVLDLNGNDLAVTGTFSNDGTLKLLGSETLDPFTNDITSGTVYYYGDAGPYDGLVAGDAYYDLTFAATAVYNLAADLIISDSLTFDAGGATTLNLGTHSVNVAGDFDNSAATGTLAGTGSVVFDDALQASTISGSTTFPNFICETPLKTLYFEAGSTQTIAGDFTLAGTSAEGRITLRSTEEGTDWNIDPQGTVSVVGVDVEDSNNINATAITASGSIDTGNNTNWTFSSYIWTGAVSTDWGTGGNWNEGFVPGAGSDVTIAQADNHAILDTDRQVNDLTINSDAILDLDGHDLTLTGDFSNDGTLRLQGNETLIGFTNDTDSGVVEYDGAGTYATLVAGFDYYDLLFTGTGSWTLTGALTVNNNLTVSSGTLDAASVGISVGNTTTIDTSTSSSATLNSSQRKSFYDTVNDYYWVFYYTGSDIEYAYSTDGSVWTTDGALGVDSTDFSLTYKDISGTGYTFIAFATDSDIYAIKGILGAASLTVDSQGIALDGSAATPFSGPSIALDANNYIWVAGIMDLGSDAVDRYQAYAVRSSAANDVTGWPAGTAIDRAYAEVNDVIMLPRTGSEMYLLSNNGENNILGYVYDGSNWSAANTGGDLSWFTFPALSDAAGTLNGSVYAMTFVGETLYLGGAFTEAGSTSLNYIAKWEAGAWSALGDGTDGTVYTFYANGTDLYVGGNFTTVDGTTVNNIALYDTTGDSWSALDQGVSGGYVRAISILGGVLYAGGTFTDASGTAVSNIARYSGGVWSAMGTGVNGEVYAINSLLDTYMIIGGDFTDSGGTERGYLGIWDPVGVQWLDLAGADLTDGPVYTMVSNESTLYLGGEFTRVGNVFGANNIGAIVPAGDGWHALGLGTNGPVTSLYLSGTDLYVGGTFTTAGGSAANNIAVVDVTDLGSVSWSALGDGIGDAVNAIAGSGTTVYAGGDFTTAGGKELSYVAEFDGYDWYGLTPKVNAIAVIDEYVYAGGAFSSLGWTNVSYLARWDGSVWSAMPGGSPDGPIYALEAYSDELYVGGIFSEIGGISANSLAKFTPAGETWSVFTDSGTGINGVAGGASKVGAIHLGSSSGLLYVGGDFTSAGGNAANYVAYWDGTNWAAFSEATISGIDAGGEVKTIVEFYRPAFSVAEVLVGGSFPSMNNEDDNYACLGAALVSGGVPTWFPAYFSLDGEVNTLIYDGDDYFYFGGAFTSVDGMDINYVGRASRAGVFETLGDGTNGAVTSLYLSGTDLYVGGRFTSAGGDDTIQYIAKYDTSVGGNGAWSALGDGVNAPVLSLTGADTTVYAGGMFTQADGTGVDHIAEYDAGAWSSVGAGSAYGLDSAVTALTIFGTDVYIGGAFTHVADIDANYIAKYDTLTGTWSAFAEGMNSAVMTIFIEPVSGDVYAGGYFTRAGGEDIGYIARWDGSDWYQLGEGISGAVPFIGTYVMDIEMIGDDLYVGGAFTSPGNGIAKYTPGTDSWSTLGDGVDDILHCFAVLGLASLGTDLYVGGDFTVAGGNLANRIALYDTTQTGNAGWSTLGDGLTGTTDIGGNPLVWGMEISGTDLYVGGAFSIAGDTAASNVAKYDTLVGGNDGWSALGDGINGGESVLSGTVILEITVIGDYVYFGGAFSEAGGVEASNIVKYDTVNTTWEALGEGIGGDVTLDIGQGLLGVPGVFGMGSIGTDLYVGGDFTLADGKDSVCVAKYGLAAAASIDSSSEISAVSDAVGNIHMIYTDASDDLKYKFYDYATEVWQSVVNLQTGTVTSPSLSINPDHNSDLYAFWLESNEILAKKGVTPYEAADWSIVAASLYSTGTNVNLITSYSLYNDSMLVGWTNGTSSPYNVMAGIMSTQVVVTINQDFIISGGTFAVANAAIVVGGELSQTSGTFIGGSGYADIAESLLITGGTFTAPQTNLFIGLDLNVEDGVTFNHNSGTVTLDSTNAATVDVTGVEGGTLDLWNFTILGDGKVVSFGVGDTFNIGGTFTVTGSLGNEVELWSVDRTDAGDSLGADARCNIGFSVDGWDLTNVTLYDIENVNYDAVGYIDLGGVTDGLIDGGNTINVFSTNPAPPTPGGDVDTGTDVNIDLSDVTDPTLNDLIPDVSDMTDEGPGPHTVADILPDVNDLGNWFGDTLGDMDLVSLVDLISPFTIPDALADVGTLPSVVSPDIVSPDTIADMTGGLDGGLDNVLGTPASDAINGGLTDGSGGIDNVLGGGIESALPESGEGLESSSGPQNFLQNIFKSKFNVDWLQKKMDDLFEESLAKTLKTKVRVSEGSVYVLDRVNNMSLIQRGEARMVYYKSRPQVTRRKPKPVTPPVTTPAADVEPAEKGLRYGTLKNPGKDVFVKGRDGEWIPAQDGMVVLPGDEIKTAEGNTVDLVLDEGKTGELRINGGTMMRINKMTEDPETKEKTTLLDLALGRMLVKAEPLKGNSKFEVRTPTALTGVRGTIFEVSVEPKAES